MKTHVLRAALAAVLAAGTLTLEAADIQVIVTDGAGVGFNDPTPAAPVGGNTGTTIGAQRLIVFKEAARIWGAVLPSDVTININSSFSALTCSANSAVLGSAGGTTVHANFSGAPLQSTWYNKAEADKLSGGPQGTNPAAIQAPVQQRARQVGLPDRHVLLPRPRQQPRREHQPPDRPPPRVRPRPRVHVGREPDGKFIGSGSSQFPGIFDRFLFDTTAGKTWDQMATDAERVASGTNTGHLVWTGAERAAVREGLQRVPPPRRHGARARSPGTYTVGTASFGALAVQPRRHRGRGRVGAAGRVHDGHESRGPRREDRARRPGHVRLRPEGQDRPGRGRRGR